jgi:YhcG PDDEXK nuclease domain
VGRQVHFEVVGGDFSVDLPFFHVLQLGDVDVDVEDGRFKPEYAGQLGFYVGLVDDRMRLAQHQPTVGLLLCADRNHRTVRYALGALRAPLAVATYTYDTLPPDEQAALPPDAQVISAITTSWPTGTAD